MTQQSPRVAMVDDDDVDAFTIRKAFSLGRLQTDFRYFNGGHALLDYLAALAGEPPIAAKLPPDVILLDINMPQMSGYEVLKTLRANPRTRHMPVVMLTTSDLAEHIEESYRRGANSYIVKPSSVAEMRAFVDQFEAYWFRLVRLPAGERSPES